MPPTYAQMLGLTPEEVSQIQNELLGVLPTPSEATQLTQPANAQTQSTSEAAPTPAATQPPAAPMGFGDFMQGMFGPPGTPGLPEAKGAIQSGIRDVAKVPAEAIRSTGIPGANTLSSFIPETPSGWAGLGATMLAGPEAGLATRAILGGLGTTAGALVGGEEHPIAKGVINTAAIPATGYLFSKPLDWAARAARSTLGSSFDTTKLLDSIAHYIPDIPENLQGSALFKFFTGKGAQQKLSQMYDKVATQVSTEAGKTGIKDPVLGGILSQYNEYFPAGLRGPIAGGYAGILAKRGAITVDTAIEAAKQIFQAASRIDPTKRPLDFGEAMAANRLIRESIGKHLGDIGKPELAQAYLRTNQRYAQGKAILNLLDEKVFNMPPTGKPSINFDELGSRINSNVKALENMPDFVQAALRGQDFGNKASVIKIPFYSRVGHTGIHARAGLPNPNVPSLIPGLMPATAGVTAGLTPSLIDLLSSTEGQQ